MIKRIAILVSLAATMLVTIGWMSSCNRDEGSDAAVFEAFEGEPMEPEIMHTDEGLRYIRTMQAGKEAPTIVFVHGAPGGADGYYDYLKDENFRQEFNLITVDRMGYGGSHAGDAEPSFEMQAQYLMPIIDALLDDSTPIILVGHSFGGPIIAKIAMMRPDDIDGLMFLAPAIDPANEKYEWAGKFGAGVPGKWITPRNMETAAVEKKNHVSELRKIEDDWDLIQSKVIYLHGDKDDIVPYNNYWFAQRKLAHVEPNMVTLYGENHFIPFNRQGLVKDYLRELVEMVRE